MVGISSRQEKIRRQRTFFTGTPISRSARSGRARYARAEAGTFGAARHARKRCRRSRSATAVQNGAVREVWRRVFLYCAGRAQRRRRFRARGGRDNCRGCGARAVRSGGGGNICGGSARSKAVSALSLCHRSTKEILHSKALPRRSLAGLKARHVIARPEGPGGMAHKQSKPCKGVPSASHRSPKAGTTRTGRRGDALTGLVGIGGGAYPALQAGL